MTDLLALADRVEKEAAGSRELDHEIHAKVVAPHLYDHIMWPSYTTSIDAAMLLVPEGMEWLVRSASHLAVDNKDQCYANVGNQSGEAHADTGSCALCAAALRALASTGSAT